MSLGHGDLAHSRFALLVQFTHSDKEKDARLDLPEHPDEPLLLNLEAGNRFAELLPIHRVVVRSLKGACHCSREDPRDYKTRKLKHFSNACFKVISFSQFVSIRYEHIIEFDVSTS